MYVNKGDCRKACNRVGEIKYLKEMKNTHVFFLIKIILLFVCIFPYRLSANEYKPSAEPVIVTCAVVGTAVAVVGLGYVLIKDSYDNVVAAKASAGGPECNTEINTCIDTGISSAWCSTDAENNCGFANAFVFVDEVWFGNDKFSVKPFCRAKPGEGNWAKSEASGTIDGVGKIVKAQDKSFSTTPENDLQINIKFDTIFASVRVGSDTTTSFNFDYYWNETSIFSTNVQINSEGVLETIGDIDNEEFVVSLSESGLWQIELYDFERTIDIPIDVSLDTINFTNELQISTNIKDNINCTSPDVIATTDGSVCEGEPLTFTATSDTGVTYTWLTPDGTIVSTNSTYTFTPSLAQNGEIYTVIATGANGCESTPFPVLVEVENCSIQCTVSLNHLNVSCPSNADGYIEAEFIATAPGNFTTELYFNGVSVGTNTFNVVPPDVGIPITIPIGNEIPQGDYYLTITTPTGYICEASATIMSTDFEPPIIQCPDDIILQVTDNDNSIVTWDSVVATDSCSIVTISSTHNSGDNFLIGTTTVSFTATDDSGNEVTCSFDIIVIQNTDTCLDTLEITTLDLPIGTYQADDIIISNATITSLSGGGVTYQAGVGITLESGFEASGEVDFSTEIKICDLSDILSDVCDYNINVDLAAGIARVHNEELENLMNIYLQDTSQIFQDVLYLSQTPAYCSDNCLGNSQLNQLLYELENFDADSIILSYLGGNPYYLNLYDSAINNSNNYQDIQIAMITLYDIMAQDPSLSCETLLLFDVITQTTITSADFWLNNPVGIDVLAFASLDPEPPDWKEIIKTDAKAAGVGTVVTTIIWGIFGGPVAWPVIITRLGLTAAIASGLEIKRQID